MTIKVINLNKLLKLFALPENKLISELRDDLRGERDKLLKKSSGGGHFHHPWWDAAKDHAVGLCDLAEQTEVLIEIAGGRKRLYRLLTKSYLQWLDRLRRSTNRPIGWVEEKIHTHYTVPGMDLTVKVDNLLALKVGEDHHRLVYPYFTEEPTLSEKWARVGLWLLRNALSEFDITEMEILDILRARSFSGGAVFLKGDEEALFARRYGEIASLWHELRPTYGL
jgi:hypothetical protein